MDFITNLLPIQGLDSILSVVDHGLTKGIILIPCSKLGATTDVTATMILNNVFKRFRLPDKILSDQGPQFASRMFHKLMKKLGIQTALLKAYHPQLTEQQNISIKKSKHISPSIVHHTQKTG